MKYVSEVLGKAFNTEKECLEAEEKHSKALKEKEAKEKALSEQRAIGAKEVEEAYIAARKAKQHYNKLLEEFLRDSKSFHATFRDVDPFFYWF